MKTLFLMRHAKSSWDDETLADFDRPLNGRGMRAAPFMGELMKRAGYRPAILLSSPAARARNTATAVEKAAGLEVEIQFDDSIYEASSNGLKQVIAGLDDRFSSVMLVGHNPGIEGFTRYLTCQIEPMPTAAIAVIDIDVDSWSDVDTGSGTLRRVLRPKDEARA